MQPGVEWSGMRFKSSGGSGDDDGGGGGGCRIKTCVQESIDIIEHGREGELAVRQQERALCSRFGTGRRAALPSSHV